ncbi:MAG TPA: hypothetical protein DCP92_05195, partial [Nitrospiraceae bacterium]|nr:hypothetical protein [Nitrospiraceae bacterium]
PLVAGEIPAGETVAMCYYLLLTYIKYQTKYGFSLLQLSRVIREMLFERKALTDMLTLMPED